MVKYLYIKKFISCLDVYTGMMVGKRRANIDKLVRLALSEASLKQKKIETIDPLVKSAKRLFPYLHDNVVHEYARTALRVIKFQTHAQTKCNGLQTTLLTHMF
jgi:hypothetical protein